MSEAFAGLFALQAGNVVPPKVLEQYERIVDEADSVAIDKTAKIIQVDTDGELRKLVALGKQTPTLILHGDTDQGTPLAASSVIIKEMLPWAELKIYEKGGHGMLRNQPRKTL